MLAGASAAVSLVWIAWVADLKGLYLDVFRAALREGTLRPAVDLPPVDLVSLETLFGALNSADDHEVLAAMDLLAEEGRARLIPALILYHPSQRVVLRALELFALDGRADFLPVAERLMRHADAEIRAAALRARTRVRPDEALLRAAASDPSPLVRATAVAGRVAAGWEGDEARLGLEGLLADGETSLALARAIVAQPSPAFEDVLLRLADGPSDVTLVQVARAMGADAQPALPARAAPPAGPERGADRGPRGARRLRGGGPRLPRRGPRRRRVAGGAAAPPAAHDRPLRRHPRPRPCSSATSSRSARARCATASCAA